MRDRDVRRIVAAPLQRRHWQALLRMMSTYDRPVVALARYLANAGRYPWTVTLSTPTGPVSAELADRHDLLTVNEIFCRQDYGTGHGVRNVVDVGANVGLAALFFLTRSPDVRVWCFEPDPANVARLSRTLAGYESRYVLTERAVTPEAADVIRFVSAGRYGHTAAPGEEAVELPAVGIQEALTSIAAGCGTIDVLKIDTEGSEPQLVAAVSGSPVRSQVAAVVYEDGAGLTRWVR